MSLLSKERKHALQEAVVDSTTAPSSGNLINHDQSQDLHNYNSSNSVISFESGHNNNFLHNVNQGSVSVGGGGSYLRFDHQQQQQISPTSNGYDDYPFWEDNTSLINESYPHYQKSNGNNGKAKRSLSRDFNYDQISGSSMNNNNNNTIQQTVVEKDQQFGWPSSSSQSSSEVDMAAIEAIHDVLATQQSPVAGAGTGTSLKRRLLGDNTQAIKKQCNDSGNGGSVLINSKSKTKSTANPSLSKDPQSIAAKNRRERISERLKILQEMVPNGSKVDLVTMLEKAISYVKFLQLQVKVLATDEFWPTAGGKAPNLSQVREAIDAILASHRDRNSSSK